MGRTKRWALLLTGLGAVMFATTEWAAGGGPTVSLDPKSGPVGTTVTVIGDGWGSYNGVAIYWDDTPQDDPGAKPLATVTSPGPHFERDITVPSSAPGVHEVIVCDQFGCGGAVAAPFTVTTTTTTTKPSSTTRAPTTTTTRGTGATTTTTRGTGATTTTTAPPPGAPPVLPRPTDELLMGRAGVGIGTGLFGPSTVLRLGTDGIARLPERGFVPRCAPPDGATILDFDDLGPGSDAREAYAEHGVHLLADNLGTDGVTRSVDVDETVEVVVPPAGTISEPNALRWVEPGPGRQYAHNALEIRFDTPQRVVGMYVGQTPADGHGSMTLIGGTVDARQDGFDEVFVSGGSAITTCMLLTRADGSTFDTVTLYGYDYSAPELDRLFFSTDPLPAPPPSGPASVDLFLTSPRDGATFDAAEQFSVTGNVVLQPPVGGFPAGADPVDEVRVTLADWDRESFVTREAELAEPSLSRGTFQYRFRVDGLSVAPGTTRINAVAYGPGLFASDQIEVEGTGPPVRTLEEYEGLVDIMPFSAEVTQGLRGALEPSSGAIDEQSIHVADRDTVVRVYGRVDFPTDPDAFDVRRRAIPAEAQLIGIRGGRALPGSPLSPTTPVLDVQPVPGTTDALAAQRLNREASWNFVLPDEWTRAGRVLLIAIVNPPSRPTHFEEAAGSGGLRNWLPISPVRFSAIAPRPVHLVLTESHWRADDGTMRRATPSIGHIADLMTYWYRVFPVPRGGLPIESIWLYPLRFRACMPADARGTVCQQPPELTSPPRWDNAVIRAQYPDVIGQNKLAFIPTLFHPDSPVGCSGRAGVGAPPLFHAGACGPTVAQEAGHSLGLDHVSNAHRESSGGGFYERYEGDHGEMNEDAMGWDVRLMQPVPPTSGDSHRHDFMSYGGDAAGVQWPSLETWNLLAEAMRTADEGAGRVAAGDSPRLASTGADEPADVLIVSGEISGDRAVLGAGVPAEVVLDAPAAEADLRFEVRDAAGEVLAVHRFTGRASTHRADLVEFEEPIALVDDAAVVVLMRRDAELARLEAADGDLEISRFTATVDGDELALSWDAPAGAAYLQANGGEGWRTVAGPVEGGETTIARGALGGLDGEVSLRMAVTDGVRLALSDETGVELAPTAPQPVILGLPSRGPVIVGRSIVLRSDILGGDAQLLWELDGDEIGAGPSAFLAGLEPGEHTVTLRALVGQAESVDERTFIVDRDADGDGLGDAWEDEHGLDSDDPSDRDSDGDEDALMAWEEQAAGSDPREIDTDGDDYADAVEVAGGSDPDDPESVPVRLHGDPAAAVPRLSDGGGPGSGGSTPLWVWALVTAAGAAAIGASVWWGRQRRARAAD